MVEGRAVTRVTGYCEDHALEIVQDLTGRDPKSEDASTSQPSVTTSILLRLITASMRLTINLDAELGGVTIEVECVGTRRMLFPPFVIKPALAELFPKYPFRKRHRAPEFARLAICLSAAFEHFARLTPRYARPSTMLRPRLASRAGYAAATCPRQITSRRYAPLPEQARGGSAIVWHAF
jgi:hypothetical protein